MIRRWLVRRPRGSGPHWPDAGVLDGPGLYRELRGQSALPAPIIFLTRDSISAETRMYLEETAVTNLSKPFALSHVRRVVWEVLAGAHTGKKGGSLPNRGQH